MRRLMLQTVTALTTATMIAACGGSNGSMSNTPATTIAKAPANSGDAQTAPVATDPAD